MQSCYSIRAETGNFFTHVINRRRATLERFITNLSLPFSTYCNRAIVKKQSKGSSRLMVSLLGKQERFIANPYSAFDTTEPLSSRGRVVLYMWTRAFQSLLVKGNSVFCKLGGLITNPRPSLERGGGAASTSSR